jgi:hypothetical protein
VAGAAGTAVALERGEGSSHFIVAVNPGDDATRLDIRLEGPFDDAASLEPVDLAGLGGVTASPIDGGRGTLELPPHAGSVLRIR